MCCWLKQQCNLHLLSPSLALPGVCPVPSWAAMKLLERAVMNLLERVLPNFQCCDVMARHRRTPQDIAGVWPCLVYAVSSWAAINVSKGVLPTVNAVTLRHSICGTKEFFRLRPDQTKYHCHSRFHDATSRTLQSLSSVASHCVNGAACLCPTHTYAASVA